MKIRITAGGIYDGTGTELPVGTEVDVDDFEVNEEGQPVNPHPWGGRFIALSGGNAPTDDAGALKAEHHGGGKFNITRGEEVLLSGISKTDADAFNALSDEDKAAFVAQAKD